MKKFLFVLVVVSLFLFACEVDTEKKSGEYVNYDAGDVTEDGYIQGDASVVSTIIHKRGRPIVKNIYDVTAHNWENKWQTGCSIPDGHLLVGVGVSTDGININVLRLDYIEVKEDIYSKVYFSKRKREKYCIRHHSTAQPQKLVIIPRGYVITGIEGSLWGDEVTHLAAYYKKYNGINRPLTGRWKRKAHGSDSSDIDQDFNLDSDSLKLDSNGYLTGIYMTTWDETCVYTMDKFNITNITYKSTYVNPTLEQFAKKMHELRYDHRLVGVSAAMLNNGQKYIKHFGFTNRETKTRMHKDTMVRWASMSKTLTAVAALIMVADISWLNLNDSIGTIINDFISHNNRNNNSHNNRWFTSIDNIIIDEYRGIQLQELLSNTSGIGHYGDVTYSLANYDVSYYHPLKSLETFANNRANAPINPNTYKYSSFGFVLVTAILDAIARSHYNKNYISFVRDEISTPLGLSSLQPDYGPQKNISHRAIGYNANLDTVSTQNIAWKLGTGGWISNIDDLYKFMKALNDKYAFHTHFSHVQLRNNVVAGSEGYGLGLNQKTINSHTYYGHGGTNEQSRTFFYFSDDKSLGFAILSNSAWDWDRDELLRRLDTEFY